MNRQPKLWREDGLKIIGPDCVLDPDPINRIGRARKAEWKNQNIILYPLTGESQSVHEWYQDIWDRKSLRRSLGGSKWGIASCVYMRSAEGRAARYLSIGSKTFTLTRIKSEYQIVPLPETDFCNACNKEHAKYGIEIEFDAPKIVKLDSKIVEAGINFKPIGRDGGGQGEVRSIPNSDFRETAISAVKYLHTAMEKVRAVSMVSKELQKQIAKLLKKGADPDIINLKDIECDPSPNGIHIHAPKDAYLLKLFQVVAVWWNQREGSPAEMLALRLKKSYGDLDAVRKSEVCSVGKFQEYRMLNAGTEQDLKTLLFPVLGEAIAKRTPLPEIEMKYKDSEAWTTAKEFCSSILSALSLPKEEPSEEIGIRNSEPLGAVQLTLTLP